MTPIVKMVGDYCNLKCAYCFYNQNDQSARHVMDVALLEKFLSEYLDLYDGKLKFVWHGGEPLRAGLPFFEKIIEFQEKYAKRTQEIANLIQTNATLITENWAKFFLKHNFKAHTGVEI